MCKTHMSIALKYIPEWESNTVPNFLGGCVCVKWTDTDSNGKINKRAFDPVTKILEVCQESNTNKKK